MTTDSNLNPKDREREVAHILMREVEEDLLSSKATRARRKIIREAAKEYLELNQLLWRGLTDSYYIGPDVDNNEIIYISGKNANHAINQMRTDGKRTSLRRPRVKKPSPPQRRNTIH